MSTAPAKSAYVHGGTDDREVARLEKQAAWVSRWSMKHFDAAPGMRVLDLATGVGAMAAQLRTAFPGVEVVGVDLSPTQLRAARANHPEVPVGRATGAALPFPDATFDRVHCSWLLEHLSDPVAVLREVERVLKPGGWCCFFEVDNSSFRLTPTFDEVDTVMRALDQAQLSAGGDPWVGQRLAPLFRAAGFHRFTIEPFPLTGTSADPHFREGFLTEFAEIFESLDESLSPALHGTLTTAAARVRSLNERPDGAIAYAGRIARGFVSPRRLPLRRAGRVG